MRAASASWRRWCLNSVPQKIPQIRGWRRGRKRRWALAAGLLGYISAPPCSWLLLLRVAVAHQLPSWGCLSSAPPPPAPQTFPSQAFWREWLLFLPEAEPESHIPSEMQCGESLGPCVPPGVERLPAEETHSAGPATGDGTHRDGESLLPWGWGWGGAGSGQCLGPSPPVCPSVPPPRSTAPSSPLLPTTQDCGGHDVGRQAGTRGP